MGLEVCRSVAADPGMEIVAAVDPRKQGVALRELGIGESGVVVQAGISALKGAGAEVAVDFTTPSAVASNIRWCIENSIHAVVGTTGLSQADVGELSEMCSGAQTNVVYAPNFAIGAVLMMRFAEMAAKWLPEAEIIELHHPGKLDSPSGTSLATAEAIGRGRRSGPQNPFPPAAGPAEPSETVAGARGADAEGVRIHSVRLSGLVAHQIVVFGGQGQTLVIRHDSIDRSSFMPGVLLAIREVLNHRGLTVGLGKLLDIDD